MRAVKTQCQAISEFPLKSYKSKTQKTDITANGVRAEKAVQIKQKRGFRPTEFDFSDFHSPPTTILCCRCVCDDGWFGPVCSHRYNACDSDRHNCSGGSTCVPMGASYECDCPAGRTGRFCDGVERLSDVRFLGKRSYLSVAAAAELNTQQFSVELEIKPSDGHGVVFFVKHHAARDKFLCLSLYGGVLELRISVRGTAATTEKFCFPIFKE